MPKDISGLAIGEGVEKARCCRTALQGRTDLGRDAQEIIKPLILRAIFCG
jgi:hypothetical protein